MWGIFRHRFLPSSGWPGLNSVIGALIDICIEICIVVHIPTNTKGSLQKETKENGQKSTRYKGNSVDDVGDDERGRREVAGRWREDDDAWREGAGRAAAACRRDLNGRRALGNISDRVTRRRLEGRRGGGLYSVATSKYSYIYSTCATN